MENEKLEFCKMQIGEILEGRIIDFVNTLHGAAIIFNRNAGGKNELLGLNQVGLKRVFKGALEEKKIIRGKTIFILSFLETIQTKQGNPFNHYELKIVNIYNGKNEIKTYISKDFESISDFEVIKILEN